VLTYGCEIWALNTADMRKTETAEAKLLRRVSEHNHMYNYVYNNTIRSELEVLSGRESTRRK
jgi:hypothetical protein